QRRALPGKVVERELDWLDDAVHRGGREEAARNVVRGEPRRGRHSACIGTNCHLWRAAVERCARAASTRNERERDGGAADGVAVCIAYRDAERLRVARAGDRRA